MDQKYIQDIQKYSKYGPSKIYGGQPVKNVK